uniref:Cyclic nucleotide-binding domain-containing protein n=1 Tax=Steinernema glaseri TaxID=37863 RepID=A0A1I8APP4_9BILA
MYLGCAFGELYLFDLPEQKHRNRRCTTIRSVGFTDLYVLHRDDFSKVLLDFPRTKAQLVKKAKAMLRRDNMYIPRQSSNTIPGLQYAITMDEKLAVLEHNLEDMEELIIGQHQLFADSSRILKQKLYHLELRCMHMNRGLIPRGSLADITEDQDYV